MKAGLTQEAAARAMGVQAMQISKWERGVNAPGAKSLARLAAAYGVTTDELLRDPEQEGLVAGDEPRSLPPVMQGLPYEVRVWLQQELLDYAKAGVSDRELRLARDLLESPEVFTFYADGAPQARTEAEVLMGMRALATGIRNTLRRRGYKLTLDSPF
jgi:transcriptional regulator with XRE-family HTH domain